MKHCFVTDLEKEIEEIQVRNKTIFHTLIEVKKTSGTLIIA